jgi:hypothetical protein
MSYQPDPSSGGPVEPDRGPAPPSVLNAVKLMYVGAAVGAVSLVVSLLIPLSDVAASKARIKKEQPSLNASQVSQTFTAAIEVAIISGVIGTVLWLWMARANGQGRNWARILSTVFFGLATLTLVATLKAPSLVGTVFGTLTWLVGLAAIVLLWRKDSTDFYRPTGRYDPSIDAHVKPPTTLT